MPNRDTTQNDHDDAPQNEGTGTQNFQGGRRRQTSWGTTVRNVLVSLAAIAVIIVASLFGWSWFTAKPTAQPVSTVQQPVVPTTPVQQGGNVLTTTTAGNTSVSAQVGSPNVIPGPGGSASTVVVTSEAVKEGYTHYFGPAGKMGNNTTIICPTACKIPEPQVNVTLPPITVDLTVPPVQAAPVQQPTVPTTPTVPASPAPAVNPAPANPAPPPAPAKVTNVQQPPATQVVTGYNCHGQPVYGPRPWSK